MLDFSEVETLVLILMSVPLKLILAHQMAHALIPMGRTLVNVIRGFVGDGFVCDVDICTLCEVGATCDSSTCLCPSEKSGTGISCDASSQTSSTVKKTVIPLSKIPEISARTTKCTDSYWHKIGAMGLGTTLVTTAFVAAMYSDVARFESWCLCDRQRTERVTIRHD